MKTEQLSSRDQRRVSDALAKCAAATKSIEDPTALADAAYTILKADLGDNPGLVKVACRVYNSCKSIHKLSAAGDDNRGDSFAILDANAMADRMAKEASIAMRKAASAPATFTVIKPAINTSQPMRKAASAESGTIEVKATPLSTAECRAITNELVAGWEELAKEASALYNEADGTYNNAMDRFVAALFTVPTAMRKTAAAQVYANYKEVGELLIEHFNEARPMYKVASVDYKNKYKGTPAISDQDLAECASAVVDSLNNLIRKRAYANSVVKEAVRSVDGLVKGLKKSAGVADTAVKTAVTADVLSDIPSFLGYGYTDEYAKNKLQTIELENAILAAGTRRSFMKAVQNDTIATYPLPDIEQAHRMALAKLPPSARRNPSTRDQALIEANMIATLAEGGTPSKADRELILTAMKNYDYRQPASHLEI